MFALTLKFTQKTRDAYRSLMMNPVLKFAPGRLRRTRKDNIRINFIILRILVTDVD